jgi:hypothetical protein
MIYRVRNEEMREHFVLSYDPREIKVELDDLQDIVDTVLKTHAELLDTDVRLSRWYDQYLLKKQAIEDAAAAELLREQIRTDALAKLTPEEKEVLGLN